ncbi:MAG: VOC family protein [Gammaproteobacteria bacterium]|nr:VOC family protein [Gammaproteobacteria bacterium]
MRAEKQIDYVEIPVTDLQKVKEFFTALFGWSFQEWGDGYLSFNDGRLDGGFQLSEKPTPTNGVVLIFYSSDLERDVARVQELGASISQEIFPFPGGRRFHFIDPVGTEYAIWSENMQANTGD